MAPWEHSQVLPELNLAGANLDTLFSLLELHFLHVGLVSTPVLNVLPKQGAFIIFITNTVYSTLVKL